MVHAAKLARGGEVIQLQAGAPELLARYRNAPSVASCAAACVFLSKVRWAPSLITEAVMGVTEGITPIVCDPQAPDWGRLSWSEWQDLDEAYRGRVIPVTPGIYRFRARGERAGPAAPPARAGCRGWRTRLDDLARGRKRHPPEFYLNWRAAELAKRPHRGHPCRSLRTPMRGRRVPCRGLVGDGRALG